MFRSALGSLFGGHGDCSCWGLRGRYLAKAEWLKIEGDCTGFE